MRDPCPPAPTVPIRTAMHKRRLLWWRAVHEGMTDYLTGEHRRYSVDELAEIFGVSRMTVYRGLEAVEAVLSAAPGAAHERITEGRRARVPS